jgi:hypothetical protein
MSCLFWFIGGMVAGVGILMLLSYFIPPLRW